MAARAGLVRKGQFEERIAEKTRRVEAAYLEALYEVDRAKAVGSLQRAKAVAAAQSVQVIGGACQARSAP